MTAGSWAQSPGRSQALSAGAGGQRPAGEARPLEGVLEAEGWGWVRGRERVSRPVEGLAEPPPGNARTGKAEASPPGALGRAVLTVTGTSLCCLAKCQWRCYYCRVLSWRPGGTGIPRCHLS